MYYFKYFFLYCVMNAHNYDAEQFEKIKMSTAPHNGSQSPKRMCANGQRERGQKWMNEARKLCQHQT